VAFVPPGTPATYTLSLHDALPICNTVTAFDPATGTFGASVFAGSEPLGIAASADGSFLYVGDAGATAVVRAALPALALDESIARSEEHTSELQSLAYLVCRLLLEK